MAKPSKVHCAALQCGRKVFVLHCGLDVKRVERSCAKLGSVVSITTFRKEEVFSYYLRLDRPRPDLIVIRSHFHSLVVDLNQKKHIPTVVVSTHPKPAGCKYPFIRAAKGYDGSEALDIYQELAMVMHRELRSGQGSFE